jgi:hypothetical protein
MKKIVFATMMAAALAGCGTSDPYQKRIDAERERQSELAERALDKAPKWMVDLPKSNTAVYASGTAVSNDMNMSLEKAKLAALGSICVSAGGEVDQQSRAFRTDSVKTSNESSDNTVRAMCRAVDVTGAELVERKQIVEGGQIRTYVLVSLPMGEANILRKTKMEEELARAATARSVEPYRDLDRKVGRP